MAVLTYPEGTTLLGEAHRPATRYSKAHASPFVCSWELSPCPSSERRKGPSIFVHSVHFCVEILWKSMMKFIEILWKSIEIYDEMYRNLMEISGNLWLNIYKSIKSMEFYGEMSRNLS